MGPVKRRKQKITSPYGPRGSIFHRGVDLRTVDFTTFRRQPCIATEQCKVLRIKRDGNDNGIIVLQPLNSVYDELKYIHIDIENSPVKKGQIISEGDIIGYTEIRGQSKAHHLHFEIWSGGEHYNPVEYFESRGIKYG